MILCCLVQVWAEDTKSLRYSPRDRQIQLNKAPCTTKDWWHNCTPCTVQSVPITSLYSLSGLSDRVSYSDYATGCKVRVLDPGRAEMSRQAVGPPSLLFKGYRDFSLGVSDWGVLLTILFHLVAKVKNKWSHTSSPPLCLHGIMDKTTFLNPLAPELFF
jgi:hypothetical protein